MGRDLKVTESVYGTRVRFEDHSPPRSTAAVTGQVDTQRPRQIPAKALGSLMIIDTSGMGAQFNCDDETAFLDWDR